MKSPYFLLIIAGIVLIIIGYDIYTSQPVRPYVAPTVSKRCIPTFADGGGPYYKENSPFRQNIAPSEHNGTKLLVKGRILRKDCTTPVANAVLDIWQANESGEYQDTWYRGKVKSDSQGHYVFETVIPKGYGEGTGYRPPHIHFKVFENDKEIITSQMFFPEVKGTPGFEDDYIMELKPENSAGQKYFSGYHDIILP